MEQQINQQKGRLPDAGVLVAFVVLLSFLIVFLLSILTERQFSVIYRLPLGYDFADFYRAALRLRNGQELYLDHRFVTPPSSAIFFLPFTLLDQRVATVAFLFMNLAAIISGLVILIRHAQCSWWLLPGVLASYPVLFLLERGNLDGLVFLLLCVTLIHWEEHEKLSGAALMMATLLKLYPLVLFIPALIEKRYRMILISILAGLPFLLVFPGAWQDYLLRPVVWRSAFFDYRENVSLTNAFYFLQELALLLSFGGEWVPSARAAISAALAKPLWFLAVGVFAALGVMLRRLSLSTPQSDRWIRGVLFVFPMVLFPAQVYQYTQILACIVLVEVLRAPTQREEGVWLGLKSPIIAALLALSFCHNQGMEISSGGRLFYGLVPMANAICFSIILCHASIVLYRLVRGR